MSQIKQIKDAIDIIQIIGERIQLQRSGSNWRALCPFHSEGSPSFFVSEQFQRYKCFGCGESGDAFTFLEKYEGMTFTESLSYLAELAGIKLESFKPSPEDEKRQRLLEICNLTKEYYHFVLTKHEAGQAARDYLKGRGVTTESIILFQLGYALPSWDGLISYLHKKKKYSLEDMQDAGLIITGKNDRQYDRFRHRVMFPLTNHRGQVVGFSGRVLDPQAKEAKYINSPETLLYHKSQMLFGYSELYQHIRKAREVVVVEGELDAISSAQAHVNNVVAIKGSALTTQHLQLISRVADKVLFSLDMDSAGIAATKRAINLAQNLPLEMRVVVIGNGKDPDELARSQPAEWRSAVKASVSVYEYLLQAALKQHDPNQPEGKRMIIDELAPVFGTITHAVELDVYLKKLAVALQVKEELVKTDINRFKKAKSGPKPRTSERASDSPPVSESHQGTRQQKLEIYVLYLLFNMPGSDLVKSAKDIESIDFELPGAEALITQLASAGSDFELSSFIKALPEDLRQLYFERSSDPEFSYAENLELQEEWQKVVADLRREDTKKRINEIEKKLATLDGIATMTLDQETEQQRLLAEIVSLRQITAFKNED